jgi:heme-degrading monooxygenase HmoA
MIRIVKMTFHPDRVDDFTGIFNSRKDQIAAFPGYLSVQLLQDSNRPEVFFTLSTWRSHEDLEHYRQSEFFKDTWQEAKALFSEKPEAWSLYEIS